MAQPTSRRSRASIRTRKASRSARSSLALPRHLRELERWLVRRFPLRRSHEIHVRPLRGFGIHWEEYGGGENPLSVLVISSTDAPAVQVESLIHEWAHARERGKPKKRERKHGKRWGREYWPIYSAWHDVT